jgi:arylsulfatase A-like enzyme
MVLFSIAFGVVGYLLSTLVRNKQVNYFLNIALLFVTALPFLIEFFIYKQFKTFYDIGSMFSNGADALGGFYKDILRMIFSWDGFTKILLFLLPMVLYAFLGGNLVRHQRSNALCRIGAASAAVIVYMAALFGIMAVPQLDMLQTDQYSFNGSVNGLGLISAFRLDVQNMFKEDEGGFELGETIPTIPEIIMPTKPTKPTDPANTDPFSTDPQPTETEPIVYTPNIMDLQFDESAKGKIKELNAYVQSLTASMKNEYTGIFAGKNLVMITAEAFAEEAIDPFLTPTLYRLANSGIQFTDYYQTADSGTTGGEYLHLFGMLPTAGGKSVKNTQDHVNYFTMGSQLNRLGYYGQAFHNNSYTYYDRHKTHVNLGYSAGFMGYGNGMEEFVRKQWPQSDLEMIKGTLPLYIDQQPFNVYYMTVSGHSNYTKSGNTIVKQNWDRVQHLPYSDEVKGYYAAQLGLEDMLAHLVEQLELAGIADDTVIVLTTDHYPYGLDEPYLEELYGFDVKNKFDRDHNRLIIWSGCLEDREPIVVDEPTGVLDILPTLSNLFGTEFDSRLFPGRDVFSDAPVLVFNMSYDWKTEYGTYIASKNKFYPVSDDLVIPDSYVSAIKQIVKNKVRYCELVLDSDYFRSLFPNG